MGLRTNVYTGVALAALCLSLSGPALAAQVAVPLGNTMNVPGVGMNLACADLKVDGTLNAGSAQINQTASMMIGATGQVLAGSATITIAGNWNNLGLFSAGSSTVVLGDGCPGSSAQLTGSTTFFNLTVVSAKGKTFNFPPGAQITVLGTLTLQGVPGAPVHIATLPGQAATITLAPGATLVQSNAEIGPTVQITSGGHSIPTLASSALVALSMMILALMGMARRRRTRT